MFRRVTVCCVRAQVRVRRVAAAHQGLHALASELCGQCHTIRDVRVSSCTITESIGVALALALFARRSHLCGKCGVCKRASQTEKGFIAAPRPWM